MDMELASEITDHAEEMLLAADEDGFVAQYDPTIGYARADDGWLLAVRYDDNGAVTGRYRVTVNIYEEVTND